MYPLMFNYCEWLIFSFQYDVELYQRIEHLIEKKLPEYRTQEEEVMVLNERVSEAQRFAKMVSCKGTEVILQ